MLAGVAIAFSSGPIYTYYLTVPRLWGITVLDDQALGGLIMWIPGSMMFLAAAIALIASIFDVDHKAPLDEGRWASDESMLAPGWKG